MKDLFEYYVEGETEERCGFALNDGQVIELSNIAEDKAAGFEIDPRDTLRYIDDMSGIWHTHPNKTSVLSGQDKQCFEQWPDVDHFVIGNDGIRKYRVMEGVVVNANHIPR